MKDKIYLVVFETQYSADEFRIVEIVCAYTNKLTAEHIVYECTENYKQTHLSTSWRFRVEEKDVDDYNAPNNWKGK